MPVYRSLLLEAGGGIINRSQQAERNGDAVVAIGLGGTGTDALIQLKSEIYKRLKPDNPEEAIPKYSNLKFLAIDSDAAKINEQRAISQLNKATEYFDISVPAITAEFEAKDMLRNNTALTWLNYEEITIADAANGAGGIRQVGRYLLIKKAGELKAKLRTIINEACKGCKGELYIHLFAGISGGTGSGTFIDVCYILRHILSELGRHNAKICGYFFLPDVNLSVPWVSSNPLISEHIKKNGYAALQELDYLMSLQNNRDEFVQDYGEFSVHTNRPPVDICYLVSAPTKEGVLPENGYQYAMNVVSEYVLAYMSKVQLPPGVTADNDPTGITLKGHIANLDKAKEGITRKFGGSYDYNILGAANAEMPLSQISTYLASKLFEKFQGMYTNLPTEGDLNAFVTNTGLGYQQILAEVQKGVTFNIPVPDIAPADLAAGRNARLVTACDNWNAAANGAFQKNMKALTEKMEGDYHRSENPKSLTAKVYNALCVTYVTNPEYGPFFAKHLLYSNTQKNLINIIDGHLTENNKLREAEQRQDSLRRQELEDAEEQVKNSGVFKGGKAKRYVETMQAWYIHLTKIELYNYMETVLTEFKRGITELNNSLFNVLTTVLDTLKDTFAQNADILTDGKYSNHGMVYTWYILDIPDIQESLDDAVRRLDVNTVMTSFLDTMMDQYQKWINEDEGNISVLVSDFMNQQFQAIANRTVLDYLQIKYNTTHAATLADRIQNEIFTNEMHPKSEPLFWNNALVSLAQLATNATLSVPFNCDAIVSAADAFAQNHAEFAVRKTALTDRMFMMRFYSGVPLFAYQGIQELERIYENDLHKNGVHLYEKGEKDWRTYLPSPIPASFKTVGYHNESMDKRVARLNVQLQQAKDSGILGKDEETGQYFFFRSNDYSIEETAARFSTYKREGNIVLAEAEECRDSLQEFIDHMYDGADKLVIPNDGALDYRESTFLDYYYKYSAINEMVAKELEKRQPLLDLLAQIEKDIEEETGRQGIMIKFCKAMFTGVLEMQRSRIIYRYERMGSEEEEVLQDGTMDYAGFKVYQAFLSYQALKETLIEKINKAADEKIRNMSDETYDVSLVLKEKHDPDEMAMLKENAGVLSREKKTAILGFYEDFLKRLNAHIRKYK